MLFSIPFRLRLENPFLTAKWGYFKLKYEPHNGILSPLINPVEMQIQLDLNLGGSTIPTENFGGKGCE